jgi:acyl-coenzyme A synthetase/AMP-(fatty) acid ligase
MDIIIHDVANVYPLKIELAIAEHPNVTEVHVFSIPDIRFVDNFPRTTMDKVSKLKLTEMMLNGINTIRQVVSFDNEN